MDSLDKIFHELPDETIKLNSLRWLANNVDILDTLSTHIPADSEDRHEFMVLVSLARRMSHIFQTGSGK